jgi:L-asparagine transporter-like permease
LTTLDLTSLGVGSCCGTGMYLVAGMVARSIAGPGVIFSFIIAAVASIFSGKNLFLYCLGLSGICSQNFNYVFFLKRVSSIRLDFYWKKSSLI